MRLLKTLEEPPPHVVFILATTEPHRIPATIHSRCQRFDFRRISLEDQLRRLEHVCTQEGIEIDNDALRYIARLSDGGMRDALSLLDQIVAYAGGRITLAQVVDMTGGMASERFKELSQALRNRDGGRVLGWIGEMMAGRQKRRTVHGKSDLVFPRSVDDPYGARRRKHDRPHFGCGRFP